MASGDLERSKHKMQDLFLPVSEVKDICLMMMQ